MITMEAAEASPGPATLAIGAAAPGFDALSAIDGARYDMSDFADREALVLIFSSNRCPTAKAYAARMVALQREYAPRGVQLLAVNSNDPHLYPDEDRARMVERAAEDGYEFPYLVDAGQRMAKAYGATCTFHAFVLDGERRVRYQGRFDNSRIEAKVTSHDLRNALDDLLSANEVRVPVTRPFGCSLDFV